MSIVDCSARTSLLVAAVGLLCASLLIGCANAPGVEQARAAPAARDPTATITAALPTPTFVPVPMVFVSTGEAAATFTPVPTSTIAPASPTVAAPPVAQTVANSAPAAPAPPPSNPAPAAPAPPRAAAPPQRAASNARNTGNGKPNKDDGKGKAQPNKDDGKGKDNGKGKGKGKDN